MHKASMARGHGPLSTKAAHRQSGASRSTVSACGGPGHWMKAEVAEAVRGGHAASQARAGREAAAPN